MRYDDFAAYYRRVRARFEAAIAGRAATEPYPVEHCSLCEFRCVCAARWEAEDHLVQVAKVRRDQVILLREAGLPTLAALARAAPDTKIADLSAHTFARCATRRRCSSGRVSRLLVLARAVRRRALRVPRPGRKKGAGGAVTAPPTPATEVTDQ